MTAALRHDPPRRPVPPFTPEHERLRAEMRAWLAAELRPRAAAWEEAGTFPNEVFGWLAARGWLGLKYPRELGGGDDLVADAVLTEELAACGSGGLAAGIGAHVGIATPPIWRFGTPAQRERWLRPAIRGEKIGALAITEPDAGSDVAALRTRGQRVDGGWVVRGAKTYITNGVRADFLVAAVRTRPEPGHRGVSLLVIERGPGVTSRPLRKLGWRASDTAEIFLEDVWVPEDALLGDEGRGFGLVMANFGWERLLMALGAVGAMRTSLAAALDLARERAPAESGAVRHELARLATSLEACAALTYHALREYVAGADATRAVTMAKLLTQRANFELQDACLQLRGHAGYADVHGTARAVRDSRLGPIGGGTDEIMKEILGRSLGL